jgi:uncharacterized repeat protein (TIGR01451 family)
MTRSRERVPRWRGALAGTLLLTTLGLLFAEYRLFAAALVPLAYVAFGALSSLSGGTAPTIERRFEPTSPPPGGTVEVTLQVRNEGESALADVRIIDGVPDELAVVEGSPRAALALRPNEEATVTYSVVAKRGDHAFDDPAVRVGTASATDRVTMAVAAEGETTLSCAQSVSDPPFGRASPRRVGTHTTDSGGEGVEFHSTREYRPGDPLSRIDWRRFGKTGELTTVRFREERAARTVVVVDARPVARTTPSAGYPNGAELSAYAGERLYDALTAAGVATSVTAVGIRDGDVPGGLPADELPWAASDGAGSPRLVFEAVGKAADRDDSEMVPSDGVVVEPSAEGDKTTTETLGQDIHADSKYIGMSGGSEDGDSTASADGGATAATAGSSATTTTGGSAVTTDAPDATTDGGEADPTIRRFLARLPADAQVVLVSPVPDDWPVSLARSLSTRGHELAVLSPDVTDGSADDDSAMGDSSAGDSPGRAVAATRRDVRLWDLRTNGAATVDWDVDSPLDLALDRSLKTLL